MIGSIVAEERALSCPYQCFKVLSVFCTVECLNLFCVCILKMYSYRKIPKISPGAYIFQRFFLRGLSTEANLRFKIEWASLTFGIIFTVLALFYFVFEGNFPSTSPRRAYIWRGDLTEGFLRYQSGGLIFGGAFTWRGLFSEFYGISGNVVVYEGHITPQDHVGSCKYIITNFVLTSRLLLPE